MSKTKIAKNDPAPCPKGYRRVRDLVKDDVFLRFIEGSKEYKLTTVISNEPDLGHPGKFKVKTVPIDGGKPLSLSLPQWQRVQVVE